MTDQEWDGVEKDLQSLFNTVKLRIDGYTVHLRLQMISTFENAIMVYVNDRFEGKWLIEDCEERRRFYPASDLFVYNRKQRAAFKEIRNKRFLTIDINRKIKSYSMTWKNFKKMKAHLVRNNKSIELIMGSNILGDAIDKFIQENNSGGVR